VWRLVEINRKGWFALNRVLIAHWTDMSDGAKALYITYLFLAKWRGKWRNWCLLSDSEVADFNGWCRAKHMKYKSELIRRGLIVAYVGKKGIYIPDYDDKVVHTDGQVKGKVSTREDRRCPSRRTSGIHQRGQVVAKNPQNATQLQPPNKYKEVKKSNKRQEVKNAPVLNSHQSQNSTNRSLNLKEQIQEDWKMYWSDYPPIRPTDIDLLLSRPLTEPDSRKLRVKFVREAIRQADQRRKDTGDNPNNPVAWIFSGLHRGSHWLRDRTSNALAEKREAQIRTGYRGSEEDCKTLKDIIHGLQERGLDRGIS
jgi:hypothetical protein